MCVYIYIYTQNSCAYIRIYNVMYTYIYVCIRIYPAPAPTLFARSIGVSPFLFRAETTYSAEMCLPFRIWQRKLLQNRVIIVTVKAFVK